MQDSRTNILSDWLLWHFYEMPVFLLQVWQNYLTFASNFFSFKLLLKTFFAPWHRYKWSYPKTFDVGEFFSTLISNFFSRFLGAFMRIFLIIAGALFQVFVALVGCAAFLAWIFLPLIIVAGFVLAFA